MRHSVGLALLAVLLAAVPAQAEQTRSVEQGRQFAQRVCAECHAVRSGAARSPVTEAPTFQAIAATPGMTSIALRVALTSSHRSMPNLALTRDELDDVIAYILTLQARN